MAGRAAAAEEDPEVEIPVVEWLVAPVNKGKSRKLKILGNSLYQFPDWCYNIMVYTIQIYINYSFEYQNFITTIIDSSSYKVPLAILSTDIAETSICHRKA